MVELPDPDAPNSPRPAPTFARLFGDEPATPR
jgi:hypothetical protein